MHDVSLMVLPGPAPDSSPLFLVDRGGVWRNAGVNQSALPLTQVRSSFEMRVREIMEKLGSQAEPEPVRAGLKAACMALFKAIFPPDVKGILERSASDPDSNDVPMLRLHIDPRVEWIPWEIAHDPLEYLGLRFQVARLPIVPGGPDLSANQPHPVALVYNLLGEGVVDRGDRLFEKWEHTFEGILQAPAKELRRPVDDDWPLVDQVAEATAENADILHVTCHGGMVDQASSTTYWTLNSKLEVAFKHRIDTDLVKSLSVTKPPLVFGNACASSQVGNGSASSFSPGLASEFFDSGAAAFVGTFAPISKRVALDFAKEFYARLLGQQIPIGRALWATKKAFKDRPENDPSWLFYCLYGPPETTFAP